MHKKGFSLVEIMIVLVLIAVIMTVALPMFESYMIRTKIGSFLGSIAPLKTSVSEFRVMNGDFRLLDKDQEVVWRTLGTENPTNNSKYIKKVLIYSQDINRVTLVFCTNQQQLKFSVEGTADLVLEGKYNLSAIEWECKYSAVGTEDPNAVNKLGQYFPNNCRVLYKGDLANACKE